MGYTVAALKDKILEFHPEIAAKAINLDVSFDQQSRRYMLKLSKDAQEFGVYLDQEDADSCMDGKKCVNLAVQVAQFLAEFEDLVSPRKPG